MDKEKIFETLSSSAGMAIYKENGKEWGFGSIAKTYDGSCSYDTHYYAERNKLESLPWERKIENPRCPSEDDYPEEDGRYITMLDCDEHSVMVNGFKDGHFDFYNRTHVKWWMRIPE